MSFFQSSCWSICQDVRRRGGGAAGGPVVLMATSKGEVKIELFQKEAPETVTNFLAYISEGLL